MKIPKIIHQLWKTESIPARWHAAAQSVRRYHKNWEYRLWNDAAMGDFVKMHHPDLYPAFTDLNRPIMRADIFRYVLMHDIGGLYCDLDYEFVRPYDYSGTQVVLSLEYDEHFGDDENQIANYVFASVPKHDLWRNILADVQANPPYAATNPDVGVVTEPKLVTRVLYQSRDQYSGVRLTHQPVLSPRRIHGPREQKVYINSGMTYGFHHGWGSWKERWNLPYLRSKLARLGRLGAPGE